MIVVCSYISTKQSFINQCKATFTKLKILCHNLVRNLFKNNLHYLRQVKVTPRRYKEEIAVSSCDARLLVVGSLELVENKVALRNPLTYGQYEDLIICFTFDGKQVGLWLCCGTAQELILPNRIAPHVKTWGSRLHFSVPQIFTCCAVWIPHIIVLVASLTPHSLTDLCLKDPPSKLKTISDCQSWCSLGDHRLWRRWIVDVTVVES